MNPPSDPLADAKLMDQIVTAFWDDVTVLPGDDLTAEHVAEWIISGKAARALADVPAEALGFEPDKGADEIERLRARIAELERGLRNVREWAEASADMPMPHDPEVILDIARTTLSEVPDEQE